LEERHPINRHGGFYLLAELIEHRYRMSPRRAFHILVAKATKRAIQRPQSILELKRMIAHDTNLCLQQIQQKRKFFIVGLVSLLRCLQQYHRRRNNRYFVLMVIPRPISLFSVF